MKDASKELGRIETLLEEAQDALKNDDGRRWPPPPAPPTHLQDWALENSEAVDPDNYEACKAYVLAQLPVRPLLQPGMFSKSLADRIASALIDKPGESVRQREVGYLWFDQDHRARALVECRDLYGVEPEVTVFDEKDDQLLWSGHFVRQLDQRQMTHAQRVAELRLLDCRKPILHAYSILNNRAYDLCVVQQLLWSAKLVAQFESAVAYHYLREVVKPLSTLGLCIYRSNLLSYVLYMSSKRRFPHPGYGLGLGKRIAVPYPWNGRIHWRLLIDAVIGNLSEDSENRNECARWAAFKAAWEKKEPETVTTILYHILYNCVRTRRLKAARTSHKMLEHRLGGTLGAGQR